MLIGLQTKKSNIIKITNSRTNKWEEEKTLCKHNEGSDTIEDGTQQIKVHLI